MAIMPAVQRVKLLRPGLAELLDLCNLCGVRFSALTQRHEGSTDQPEATLACQNFGAAAGWVKRE